MHSTPDAGNLPGPTEHPASGRSKAPRNATVDAARLLFAFGVVVIHLAPPENSGGGLLARVFLVFAVQYFFIVSLFFFVKRVRSLNEVTWSSLQLDRILVPYLTWTVIYTLFRWAKCMSLNTPFELEVVRVGIYGAGAIQLYFVPLLVLWQMLALTILLLVRRPQERIVAGVVLVAALSFGFYGQKQDYYCFQNAIGNGVLYVALAFVLNAVHSRGDCRRTHIVVAALLVAAGIAAAVMELPYRRWLGPFAAYGAAALALNWEVPMRSKAWRYAFSCSFGIYLAHLAFVEVLKLATARANWPLHLESATVTVLTAALICGMCIGLAAIARAHPLPRYLLLGERSAGHPSH